MGSSWSTWSPCTNNQDGKSTCIKTKNRHCNDPPASHGGAECPGKKKEVEECSSAELSNPEENPRCVIHGAWTTWSDYGTCRSDCKQIRTRTCSNPAPIIDHDKCPGEADETRGCYDGDCATANS